MAHYSKQLQNNVCVKVCMIVKISVLSVFDEMLAKT